MNPTTKTQPSTNTSSLWFDELIATLRTHELQLETDTASEDIKKLYGVLMSENLNEIFKLSKEASQKYFVQKIILEYLKHLDKNLPLKLAFDYNDSEVMVWAEIDDGNQQMEAALERAESKINATYHPYGFDMESMIIEKSDAIPVPNHYKLFKA